MDHDGLGAWEGRAPTCGRRILRNFGLCLTLSIAGLSAATSSRAALPTPANCQNDIDGANDQPGQKDVTQYCTDLGDGAPCDLITSASWDETTLTGNNTADICQLYDTDADGLANLSLCVTLESSGAMNGNLATLQTVRLFTCGNTRGDRCTGSTLVPGLYDTYCEVSQQPIDPFSPAALNGPGDQFPTDTQIVCCVDLDDFGPTGPGATILDSCSYPSTVPNSDPSDCVLYAECTLPTECDDGNPCTTDGCTSGVCTHTPSTGEPCSDGLFCNGDEICNALGFCEANTPRDCGDGIDCTIDSCDELLDDCINDPRNSLCSDDQYCNGPEVCNPATGCEAGTAPDCSDGVACTTDTCDELTDTCGHLTNDAACADGQYCNGVETCDPVNGCLAGSPPTCDDAVDCTIDSCDEVGDTCAHAPNDAACSDAEFCNGVEACDPIDGCDAGTPTDCTDGIVCTIDSCDEESDSCTHAPDDTACNDNQFCNGVEICDPLLGCEAGTPPDCTDGVGCTIDACDEVADSCTHAPDDATCNDSLFCNGNETCDLTSDCQPGTPPNCSDGVVCTLDACNETSDSCDHTPTDAVCNDNQFCNGVETCDPLLGCQDAADPDCNDGIGCTDDSCNELTDACDNTPDNTSCSDGQFCSGVEICDPLLDCQPGSDPCPGPGTQCSEPLDQCVNCLVDADCNNGVFCDGQETCDVGTGVCVPGAPPTCSDDVDCTVDACNESSDACENTPSDAACSDGAFCTGTETCDAIIDCQPGTPPNCSDGVDCTADACSEILDACTHTASDVACDNGAYCDGIETCDAVAGCQPGTGLTCDDGVACTADSCDETTDACVNAPNDATCSNGSACDGVETCNPISGCQSGTALACDDGVACTVDTCSDAGGGCVSTPNDAACGDGVFCNGAETCNAISGCQTGTGANCNDGIACTIDTCDESSDSCRNSPSNWSCSDGVFCNGAEVCTPGIGCQAGTAPNCADGLACTENFCDPETDACEVDLTECVCGDSQITGLEECDPPTQAGLFEDCNNNLDDDGDELVDCRDPNCAPNARAEVCDEGCLLDRVCKSLEKDPGRITYDWTGGQDSLWLHGRFAIQDGLNPMIEGVTFEIANDLGAIYRAFVDPSQLKANSKGTRYRFVDKAARDVGQAGIAGGLYKVGLARRSVSGTPYVSFRVRAYGDFKFATKIVMSAQISAGTATGSLTTEWTPVRGGWELPQSDF